MVEKLENKMEKIELKESEELHTVFGIEWERVMEINSKIVEFAKEDKTEFEALEYTLNVLTKTENERLYYAFVNGINN